MCDPRTRPSFIPVPGVGKFVLMQKQDNGDVAQNILHVHHVDGSNWSVSQLSSMCTTIANAWAANVAAQVTTATELIGIRGTDQSSVTGPSILSGFAAFGSKAGEGLPAGDTLAVKMTTAKRGRSFRGRIYLVGLADVRDSQDTYNATYAAALLTAWRAVMTAINGVSNCELVVVSYCNAHTWLNPGVSTTVTSLDLVDQFVDYQRRRSTAHAAHR